MSTEVATTEPNQPALTTFEDTADVFEGVAQSDLNNSRIWVCQPLSKAVTDGDRKPGDIIYHDGGLVDETIAGGPIEVIPLMVKKHIEKYVIAANGKNELEVSISPDSPEFSQYNGKKAGVKNKFQEQEIDKFIRYCFKFYVLVTKELDTGFCFPSIISFRNTSFEVGQTLVKHITRLRGLKQPPWGLAYSLGIVERNNDMGKWWTWEIKGRRQITEEQNQAAHKWFLQLKGMDTTQSEPTAQGEQAGETDIPF